MNDEKLKSLYNQGLSILKISRLAKSNFGTTRRRLIKCGTKLRTELAGSFKGGISWNNKGYITHTKTRLHETLYRNWRRKVREKYSKDINIVCAECKKTFLGNELEVDHKIPVRLAPDKIYEVSNGQLLCCGCHRMKTIFEAKTYWTNQFGSYKKCGK